MKNRLILLVGVIVAVVLLSYMLAFVVRFDQVAVRTTFGSADEASVIREPGIRMRLPWPFQQVYQYSTRVQLVETSLNQLQTSDGYSIIVKPYMTWRIEDPLKFYTTLRDEPAARDKLIGLLQSVGGQIGAVRFTELVNIDRDKIKLAEVEKGMLDTISRQLASLGYGIVAEHVGIRRIVLPEPVTAKVFERMKTERENRAASVRTRGTAQANAIVSDANSIRKSILSFANKYAEEIKTRGITQSAEEYKVFAQDQQFANYLRAMEAMEAMLTGQTTFVIDPHTVPEYSPFRFLLRPPQRGSEAGETVATPPLKE